jgi:hypothetical protein
LKNGSQAANSMFSAFPEMTLTACLNSDNVWKFS